MLLQQGDSRIVFDIECDASIHFTKDVFSLSHKREVGRGVFTISLLKHANAAPSRAAWTFWKFHFTKYIRSVTWIARQNFCKNITVIHIPINNYKYIIRFVSRCRASEGVFGEIVFFTLLKLLTIRIPMQSSTFNHFKWHVNTWDTAWLISCRIWVIYLDFLTH